MALPGVIAGLFPAVYGCPSLPFPASGAGQEGYKKHSMPRDKARRARRDARWAAARA